MRPRRDLFVYVAKPGTRDETIGYLTGWLESLAGHPGFLGGSVLVEEAEELLPDTMVVIMDFESGDAARALWPKIENTINPLYPDDKSDRSPDQGPAFFDDTAERVAAGEPSGLRFTRGDGRVARMLHIHAEVASEVSA